MNLTDALAVTSLALNVIIVIMHAQLKTVVSDVNTKLAQMETKLYKEFITKEDAPRLIPLRQRSHENSR